MDDSSLETRHLELGTCTLDLGVDLHTHSTASDGLLAPQELVEEAARRGLTTIALTDHDTVRGVDEAVAAGERLGVEVIPGVELGSDVAGREVHLLGYFVDPTSSALLAALQGLAARRRDRMALMVARLNDLGVPVALDEVLALAGPGSVGRPHLARALVGRGVATSVSDAFDRFLAAGRPAYVRRQPFTPEEAVALILAAGGVPTLAHPLTTGDPEAMVERLNPAGLAGLEVYYGEYDAETREWLRALADRHGMVPTGGSDYHGEGFKPGRNLGGAAVPPACLALLRAAAPARRRGRRSGAAAASVARTDPGPKS
jgi:3',5'-nucleoside bisphosphate phosphatase